MKYKIVKFKNLDLALKQLEPFIRNGKHLHTGRPFKKFGGMRSRECLANWLLCVAINSSYPDRLTFTTSPDAVGGDGVIVDCVTNESWVTEHVAVLPPRGNAVAIAPNSETLVLNAIKNKQNKGYAYASGKTLVVFLDSGLGKYYPNNIANQMPKNISFNAVWVVGLHIVDEGKYVYNVVRLDLENGSCPVWQVHIAEDFHSWTVSTI
ncbi:MAG: hypothetical protein AAB680_04520 [Pseudomonadota bacterium]